MRVLHDQLNRKLELADRPQRICSLCPSTTETLFALGAGSRVVGRTDYCRHPGARVRKVASVGGTKRVKLDRLALLRPDLVVSVREENDKGQVEAVAEQWPTLVLDPVDVPSAIAGVELLGQAVAEAEAGAALARDIEARFAALPRADVPVVYLIWRKPWMAAGAGTYLDDVLARLGLRNVARALPGRYPVVEPEWAASCGARFALAASEPFPFEAKHLPELRTVLPGAEPLLVDGELFSWHGVRMLRAAAYFRELVPALVDSH